MQDTRQSLMETRGRRWQWQVKSRNNVVKSQPSHIELATTLRPVESEKDGNQQQPSPTVADWSPIIRNLSPITGDDLADRSPTFSRPIRSPRGCWKWLQQYKQPFFDRVPLATSLRPLATNSNRWATCRRPLTANDRWWSPARCDRRPY